MKNYKEGFSAPTKCPVCGDRLEVTKLECGNCHTELSGTFEPCRFCALEESDLSFIETFLKCRGSIKEVERELGVSYPTVKNMLESALNALGFGDEGEETANKRAKEDKNEVLEKLSNKEISVEDALEVLKSLKD